MIQNLRVTAKLQTSVACDRWIPLDGILYYHQYRELYGAPDALFSGADIGSVEVDLPFARVEFAASDFYAGETYPAWYYACSWAQPQPWWMSEGKDYWSRKFDLEYSHLIDFRGKRGIINILGGEDKAKHIPIFYYVADKIEWYCVGNKDGIERLLGNVTSIGKYQRSGWGRVLAWTVESIDGDYSVSMGDRLARGVPLSHATGPFVVTNYGIRPPYYMTRNQMELCVPC